MRIQNNYQTKQNNLLFSGARIPTATSTKFNNKFLSAKSIDFYCHSDPDQDTGNALRPLVGYALAKGIKVNICINYKKTKGLFYRPPKKYLKKDSEPSELTFILDFNSKAKIPKAHRNTFYKSKPEDRTGLDHHNKLEDLIEGDEIYINKDAKSACELVFDVFNDIGRKLNKKESEGLYCGMLSDYEKSKLIEIKNGKLIKLPSLDEDPVAKELLEKIESQLNEESKNKIYKHLDILTNLTPKEEKFRKKLFSEVKVLPNKKWAYSMIDPNDKDWISLGMKNERTGKILKNMYSRTLNGVAHDENFTPKQREELKNIKGIILLYRSGGAYQLSVKSKDDSALRLVNAINIDGGGKPHSAGGRILSIEKDDVNNFINKALNTAQTMD